jgi:hypothetical protein
METHQNSQRASSSSTRQAARDVLLLCSTTALSPRNRQELSRILEKPVDWRYLFKLASFHGIIPLVTHNMETNGFSSRVPQSYLNELKQTYRGTIYRNLVMSSELVKILAAFRENGVEAICLKGAPLAEKIYGNPCLRPFGDMDILIHPEDVSRGKALLADLGYQQEASPPGDEHQFHGAPFYKKGSLPFWVELHWDLDDCELVAFSEQEIWRRAELMQFEGIVIMLLSHEDNFLYLANHLCKHDSSLLKLLVDIAELLKKFGNSLDWEYIRESSRTLKIKPAVYYVLRRIKELTDAPVEDSILKAIKPATWRWWLLDYLLSRKTFISPIGNIRLRKWNKIVSRSLTIVGTHQMLYALSKREGHDKANKWIRIAFWIFLVIIAATWRNSSRLVSRV